VALAQLLALAPQATVWLAPLFGSVTPHNNTPEPNRKIELALIWR
jgi:hypothetical protein